MKLGMNERGALDWRSIIMFPALIVLLIVVFAILDVVVGEAFTVFDAATALPYINLLKLLIGVIGLVFVLGVIWTIVSGFRQEQFQQF